MPCSGMFRILTWNIACLPKGINPYRNPKGVINGIIDAILGYKPDVIALQEVFDYNIQRQLQNVLHVHNGYNVHVSPPMSVPYSSIHHNGLMTATPHRICYGTTYNYQHSTSVELLIRKGILTTEIEMDNGCRMYIHNTHMQSDSMIGMERPTEKTRRKQFKELTEHMTGMHGKNQIVCGDLNEDYQYVVNSQLVQVHGLVHNDAKLITFPEDKQQLDYIMPYCGISDMPRYSVDQCDELSDHYMLICDINVEKC